MSDWSVDDAELIKCMVPMRMNESVSQARGVIVCHGTISDFSTGICEITNANRSPLVGYFIVQRQGSSIVVITHIHMNVNNFAQQEQQCAHNVLRIHRYIRHLLCVHIPCAFGFGGIGNNNAAPFGRYKRIDAMHRSSSIVGIVDMQRTV